MWGALSGYVAEAGLPDQRIAGSDSSASTFLLGGPGESLGFLICRIE